MMDLLNFAFSSFFTWLGCLVYLCVCVGGFGMGLGLIAELLRGK